MAVNPFSKKGRSESTIGRVGYKSESRVAKKLGAKPTLASGAMAGMKSDMTLEGVRIEAKSTQTNTMSMQYAWCVKITEEANKAGQMPAITMSFTDTAGVGRKFGEWVAIPLNKFKELQEMGVLNVED